MAAWPPLRLACSCHDAICNCLHPLIVRHFHCDSVLAHVQPGRTSRMEGAAALGRPATALARHQAIGSDPSPLQSPNAGPYMGQPGMGGGHPSFAYDTPANQQQGARMLVGSGGGGLGGGRIGGGGGGSANQFMAQLGGGGGPRLMGLPGMGAGGQPNTKSRRVSGAFLPPPSNMGSL